MRKFLLIFLFLFLAGCKTQKFEGVFNHGGKKMRCRECHAESVLMPSSDKCIPCHSSRNDHPLVVMKDETSLPLSENKKIECYTCHKVHSQNKWLLRVKVTSLCRECHPKK